MLKAREEGEKDVGKLGVEEAKQEANRAKKTSIKIVRSNLF